MPRAEHLLTLHTEMDTPPHVRHLHAHTLVHTVSVGAFVDGVGIGATSITARPFARVSSLGE